MDCVRIRSSRLSPTLREACKRTPGTAGTPGTPGTPGTAAVMIGGTTAGEAVLFSMLYNFLFCLGCPPLPPFFLLTASQDRLRYLFACGSIFAGDPLLLYTHSLAYIFTLPSLLASSNGA
jgi:hypothetical protein